MLAASLVLAAPAAAAVDAKLVADAQAFGARESVQLMDLAPSGKKLLTVLSGPGRKSLVRITSLENLQAKDILLSEGDRETIYWCAFATDVQIICKYGGETLFEGDVIGFSRLVTLTADGKNIRQLGQRERFDNAGLRQFDGDILDWLPAQLGSVLMARNYLAEGSNTGSNISGTRSGLGVDRIELSTLKVSRVEAPRDGVESYMTDGRGNVRLIEFRETATAGEMTGLFRYRYRAAGSRDWKPFGEYDVREGSGIIPLAIDADSNSAFVLRNAGGRRALYQMKLDGSGASTLVAAHKEVDIGSVVRLGRGQRVIGYTYVDDRRRTVYFDPEFKKLASSLAKALPTQPIITFVEASADGSRLLIFAYGDTHPGSYYLFEKATRRLDEVALVRPQLETRPLAKVQPITVPAADGARIPAYLTLPPDGMGKNLPAVVLPHGGPSARDEWGFDWLSQFLAARGYAVIQPNFRGSDGYGDDWLGNNGFQDWRTAINDVTASARYLVSQGIADPNRLAIVGWSYGGYAALQSAVVEPNLYRAAVAVAPVTDLSLLKRQAQRFTNRRLVKEFVGTGAHTVEGSPLRRAGEIKVPVLLVHGDLDGNVGIAHSEKMLAALRKTGSKADLLRFKGLDHSLDDTQARIQMLTRIGELLDGSIGR